MEPPCEAFKWGRMKEIKPKNLKKIELENRPNSELKTVQKNKK